MRAQLSMEGIDPEWVDKIPGKLSERQSPLGELHWTFTAIMDAIAWNCLPSPLFRKLFRQDLLVASLFRNFLLADRILRRERERRGEDHFYRSNGKKPRTCSALLFQAV